MHKNAQKKHKKQRNNAFIQILKIEMMWLA